MARLTTLAALACTALALSSGSALAQSGAKGITITRADGGPVKTELGYGITLNRESSLRRQWVTVHDEALPLDINGTGCATAVYESGRVSGDYYYSAQYAVSAKQPVTAFEVRMMVFDVFGDRIRTLSGTYLMDMDAGTARNMSSKWRIFSENETTEYFACLSYVARVRTAAGKVHDYNVNAVLEAARQFSKGLTAADLEPEREKRQ